MQQQVEEALRVLYTTADASLRQSADRWLQEFQASEAAWEASVNLIASGATAEAKLFGATVLCNKLRGGNLGGLVPTAATSLRAALLQQLAALGDGGGASLLQQLCRAVAALLVGGVGALLADAHFAALPAPSMLRVLSLVPEGGAFLEEAEVEAAQLLLLGWRGRPVMTRHRLRPLSCTARVHGPLAVTPSLTTAQARPCVRLRRGRAVRLPGADRRERAARAGRPRAPRGGARVRDGVGGAALERGPHLEPPRLGRLLWPAAARPRPRRGAARGGPGAILQGGAPVPARLMAHRLSHACPQSGVALPFAGEAQL